MTYGGISTTSCGVRESRRARQLNQGERNNDMVGINVWGVLGVSKFGAAGRVAFEAHDRTDERRIGTV